MSGIESSSLTKSNLPVQSPEILPRPLNPHFNLGSDDFSGFRCTVTGVADKGKVLEPSVNPFSCAQPLSNDSVGGFGFIQEDASKYGGGLRDLVKIRKMDQEILFEAKPFERTTKEELKEAIDPKVIPPESGKLHNKRRKPTAPLHVAYGTQGSESIEGTTIGLGASSSCRYDSSLSLLTKKFLNLLLEASDGTLDLNKAAQELDVQKRRMYDITNVLEGIGLIEKGLKNMIRLKETHMSRPKEVEEYKARLRAEIEILRKEEDRVDRLIRERKEQIAALTQDENSRKWLYVTREDINSFSCFEDSTLIAIEAPHGTIVEVPDPNESFEFPQQLSMVLRSSIGPINCYLLSQHEERIGSLNSDQLNKGMDLCSKHDCFPLDRFPSEPSNLGESLGGMVKIEPSDLNGESDYWFLSELGTRLAEIWTE